MSRGYGFQGWVKCNKMNSKPLVSAIIIFFNTEKFITEAIESVFAQTYENWELLLVDDGSTDGSTDIARHYAEQYPVKVRYLEHYGHQNRGRSAARNLGTRNANGEYIAFLDADDVCLPHKLERQVPVLETHTEAAMLYGTSYDWYSWTGDPDDIQNNFVHKITNNPNVQVNKPLKTEEFLPLFVQRKVLIPPTSSLFVRRKAIESVGGFEESFRGLFDDQVFIAKISLEGPIVLVPEVFEKYRKHPDSCCSIATSSGRYKMRLTYLNWLEKYMVDLEIKDVKIWKALRSELLPYSHPWLYRLLSSYQSLIKQIEELVIFIGRRTLPFLVRQWLWTKWQGN